jgi:hypothetical protein
LQNPNQTNEDNPNNIRCETWRIFRNIKENIWKTKLISWKQTVRIKYQRPVQWHTLTEEGLPTLARWSDNRLDQTAQ